MAVATTRTTPHDSSVYNRGTKVFKAIIAMEIGTADLVTGGSVIPLCELPPEAIVTSIKALNDDLDDNGTDLVMDIGIWKAKKGVSLDEIIGNEATLAEALDQDIYSDGLTAFQGAVTTLTEYLGSGTNAVDLDDRFNTVRALGIGIAATNLGQDPFKYFLGLKASVSAGATLVGAGVYFEVEWVQG